MLKFLNEDSNSRAGLLETVRAAGGRLHDLVDSSDAVIYASSGIFLAHLHAEESVLGDLLGAGITSWTLSVYGTDFESLERQSARLAESPLAKAPGFAGLVVEGPFVSAQSPPAFDADALAQFLDSQALRAASVVFAPELVESARLAAVCRDRGVEPVVGHTNADYDSCREAFEAGAAALTLPFVATPPIRHRDPGPIAAAAEAQARVEVPVGAESFTPQMGAFIASAFPGRSTAIHHPCDHAGRGRGGRLGRDFAGQAAALTGLDARGFLSLHQADSGAGDTLVLFDDQLKPLATFNDGSLELVKGKGAAGE